MEAQAAAMGLAVDTAQAAMELAMLAPQALQEQPGQVPRVQVAAAL